MGQSIRWSFSRIKKKGKDDRSEIRMSESLSVKISLTCSRENEKRKAKRRKNVNGNQRKVNRKN